jgi:hypothetical protein
LVPDHCQGTQSTGATGHTLEFCVILDLVPTIIELYDDPGELEGYMEEFDTPFSAQEGGDDDDTAYRSQWDQHEVDITVCPYRLLKGLSPTVMDEVRDLLLASGNNRGTSMILSRPIAVRYQGIVQTPRT